MAQTNANRRISYYQVAGTPTAPSATMKSIKVRNFGLAGSVESIVDPSFTGTRTNGLTIDGDVNIAGNIVSSYYAGLHASWFSSVFRKAPVSGKYSLGNTAFPHLFEDIQTDASTPYSYSYRDCEANSFTLNVARGADTTLDIGWMAKSRQRNTTLYDTAPDVVGDTEMYIHKNMTFTLGGVALKVRAFSLSYNNGMVPESNLGETSPDELVPGNVSCTGSITIMAKYADAAMIQAEARNRSPLAMTSARGGLSDAWVIPNVKFTDWKKPFDNDQITVFNLTYVGDPDANGDLLTLRTDTTP